uniref:MOB kinase activator 3B n=1 Tax=Hucho hucho TaxID=62062 RepID=A0A4W5JUS9_9TELE
FSRYVGSRSFLQTFRPKRKFEPGTQRFELHKKAQASLSSGVDLRAAVALPHGEDLNDWVAVHVVDFFNRINLIYGTVCEFCTEKSCPVMSGGPRYEYRWQDDHKYKKPTALPAPKYMNLLMDWIEVQINNEDIFPTSIGEYYAYWPPLSILLSLNFPQNIFLNSRLEDFCNQQGINCDGIVSDLEFFNPTILSRRLDPLGLYFKYIPPTFDCQHSSVESL